MTHHRASGREAPDGGARPRWRADFVVAVVVVVVLVAGGAAAVIYDSSTRHHGGHPGGRTRSVLAAPKCPAAAGSAPARPATGRSVRLPRSVTAISVSADGRYTFAATGHRLDVLANTGGVPSPRPVSQIALPAAARAEALTPDGRYLLIAAGDGATVLRVRSAETGTGDPIVAVLAAPGGAKAGAAAVATSASGRYAYVALKAAGKVAVFRLTDAIARGFSTADYAGFVPVTDPAGLAGSPDGRWLYVISKRLGTISVIGQQAAVTSPRTAIIATARAGCSPTQVITSPDGAVIWVTARDSNALVGFAGAALRADGARAVAAVVPVGKSPVAEALVGGGQRIVTLDTGGFLPGAGNLAVVSTAAALATPARPARRPRPALLRLIETALLPRGAVIEQTAGGGYLLMIFDHSRRLQAVSVGRLS